jgi:hypothetical protein
LVKAGKLRTEVEAPVVILSEKLEYGKAELKRSIANVLKQTINLYNYNSLAQFNAVLRQYNVMADRGRKEVLRTEKWIACTGCWTGMVCDRCSYQSQHDCRQAYPGLFGAKVPFKREAPPTVKVEYERRD